MSQRIAWGYRDSTRKNQAGVYYSVQNFQLCWSVKGIGKGNKTGNHGSGTDGA